MDPGLDRHGGDPHDLSSLNSVSSEKRLTCKLHNEPGVFEPFVVHPFDSLLCILGILKVDECEPALEREVGDPAELGELTLQRARAD